MNAERILEEPLLPRIHALVCIFLPALNSLDNAIGPGSRHLSHIIPGEGNQECPVIIFDDLRLLASGEKGSQLEGVQKESRCLLLVCEESLGRLGLLA